VQVDSRGSDTGAPHHLIDVAAVGLISELHGIGGADP
jgi:hypothetical protein